MAKLVVNSALTAKRRIAGVRMKAAVRGSSTGGAQEAPVTGKPGGAARVSARPAVAAKAVGYGPNSPRRRGTSDGKGKVNPGID